MSTILASVAIAGVAVCAWGWWRTSARAGRLEARVVRLERELHDEVLAELDWSRRESAAAVAEARRAARAAGIEDPPPRLAAESVTGPVVRAVAFGAGARKALTRFTADVVPLRKTRRTAAAVARATPTRKSR